MQLLTVLLAVLFSYSMASASEFNHLVLKNNLEKLQKQRRGDVNILKSNKEAQDLLKIINNKILGASPKTQGQTQKSIIDRFRNAPNDISPIMQRIVDYYGDNYSQIGQNETGPLARNYQFGGGIVNMSGMTWHKPMGNFTLNVNREIAPDLLSDKFIVHDTLNIGIDAKTLLTSLKDEELIDISNESLSLFAGLSFLRTYHFYHLADSYVEGISQNFEKLFLPFLYFNADKVLSLPPHQLLKKQDHFAFNVGAVVTSPTFYFISASAGAMLTLAYKNEVAIQSITSDDNPADPSEFLRISNNKEFNVNAAVSMSVQLDFYKILKLTILSYDLEFEYADKNSIHYSFHENDKDIIKGKPEYLSEFKKAIHGYSRDPQYLINNIVEQDHSITRALNSRLGLFIYGVIRKQATEQIRTIKNGIERIFLRHTSEATENLENILRKLFNVVLQRLLKFDLGAKYTTEISRKMAIEYEKEKNLNDETISSTEKFSLKFTQSFVSDKTHKKILHKRRRRIASYQIENFTTLNPSLAQMVRNRTLIGPLSVESNYLINKKGLDFFLATSENDIKKAIKSVCPVSNLPEKLRPHNICYKQMLDHYQDLKKDRSRHGVINLKALRLFLHRYFVNASSHKDLYLIFGRENIFMQGSLSGQTKDGIPFQTFYESGQFEGLGVIDNFMRESTASHSGVN